MSPAEIRAFNAGVSAVLAIAQRSAAAVATTSTRPIAESFAIAALAELADAGRALLLPGAPDPSDPMAASPDRDPPSPAPVAALQVQT